MGTFVANEFNPETDEDRPQINETVIMGDDTFHVKKVNHMTVAEFMGAEEPEAGEYDKVLARPHATRPAIVWVAWLNNGEAPTEEE